MALRETCRYGRHERNGPYPVPSSITLFPRELEGRETICRKKAHTLHDDS